MLKNLVRLRIVVSDLAFRLAGKIPKSVRSYLKAISAISRFFDFVRDDTYRVSHAFQMLKTRQASELQEMANVERARSGSSFHVVIDGNAASLEALCQTIESVQDQRDLHLRITLLFSGSNKAENIIGLSRVLAEAKVSLIPTVFSIDAALKVAVQAGVADNEYILFLKAGDVLNKHALSVFRHYIRNNCNPEAIYSDVASISAEKPMPECRPEFCPDYIYEYNYLHSSICFRADFIRDTVLPKVAESGSVDALNHALAIVLANNARAKVQHVPYTLLESLVASEKTAYSISYLAQETLRIVGEQDGFTVQQGKNPETVRLQWRLPIDLPLVSIIIPTKDQLTLLRQCVESILQYSSYRNIEIIIVNNNSENPETFSYFNVLSQDSRVKILDYPGSFNYSAINNYAVGQSSGEYIALVNNDIEVISSDWLETMLSQCARPEIGCVGAKLYYPDDTCQHGGVVVGYGGVAGHAHKNFQKASKGYMCRLISTQNYTAVTAACLMIKKETFLKVGGLDENNLTVAFNDIDLCLKVHALGLRNIWTPHAELYHHESVSRGSDRKGKARIRFMREIEYMKYRWNTEDFKDPAYNVNLTLNREDFALRTF